MRPGSIEDKSEDSESEQSDIDYDDLLDSDGIEMPNFVVPETVEQDDEEIEYYARKLGINDEVDEWDDQLRAAGYAKILKGITSSRRNIKKDQPVKMVKAKRTQEEEEARKDFTGLLNRIAPSNYNIFSSRIREAFATHPPKVSIPMFTRCLTQRIFSDAQLPPLFIDVYSRVLKEIPDAIQPVVDALNEKPDLINVKPFLDALGDDLVKFYGTNKNEVQVDEEVKQLDTIARKIHMTTDVRRSIFYAITTAVDYQDAYTKIAKLSLSKTQRKDIPFVIIECCRKESSYNPFYAQLVSYFAESGNHFKENFRGALKNSLQLMNGYSTSQIRNLALLCDEIVEKGTFGFNLVKGIKMISLGAEALLFMKILFREIFQKLDQKTIGDEIKKISKMPNFAKDLRIFFKKRLIPFLKNSPTFPPERMDLLHQAAEELSIVQ
ncbi:nucleolar MIF4G domain-containing protein 1 [Histomonas meleagridis]|uniref:nucleolar MIF4G domain-containing protein 1 n=1 Tax=Histomonas meleagridis TaxID=135588 RepID=UPI0035599552|nr:nucleolar MIF4G domain-containing protein 1 [Histomonas meleagridis]KAH0800460.1 nucleolar MIF4G domain-containing protein 1 [Histomonas meleagridis]